MKKIAVLFSLLTIILSGCNQFPFKSDKSDQTVQDVKFNELDSKTFAGQKNAPNTIVIFNDFECKRCLEFQNEIEPKIKEDTIKGKVKVYYYHLATVNKTSYVKALMGIYFEKHYPMYHEQYIRAMYNLTPKENKSFENKQFVQMKMKKLFPGLKTDVIVDNVFEESIELTKTLKENEKIALDNRIKQIPSVFINGKQIINSFYYPDYSEYMLKK